MANRINGAGGGRLVGTVGRIIPENYKGKIVVTTEGATVHLSEINRIFLAAPISEDGMISKLKEGAGCYVYIKYEESSAVIDLHDSYNIRLVFGVDNVPRSKEESKEHFILLWSNLKFDSKDK